MSNYHIQSFLEAPIEAIIEFISYQQETETLQQQTSIFMETNNILFYLNPIISFHKGKGVADNYV